MLTAYLRRFLALLSLIVGALVAFAVPASAATDATTGHASLLSDTLIVSYLVTAAISYGIPALTDFITKAAAPTWFKNLVVMALSAIAAAIPQVTFVHGERWTDYLLGILLVAFPVAQAAHRTGYSNGIQRAVPGGIGPVDPAKAYSGSAVDTDAPDADYGDTGGSIPGEPPLPRPGQVDPANDVTSGGTV